MSVAALVPRPASVPADIPDAALIEAARSYMNGDDREQVARILGLTLEQFRNMVKGAAWRTLCAPMRDELLAAKEQINVRLESMLAEKVHDMLEKGVKTTYQTQDGTWKTSYRDPYPKELAQLGVIISDNRKWIEQALAKKGDAEPFSRSDMAEKLKRFAKADEVEGEAKVVNE